MNLDQLSVNAKDAVCLNLVAALFTRIAADDACCAVLITLILFARSTTDAAL